MKKARRAGLTPLQLEAGAKKWHRSSRQARWIGIEINRFLLGLLAIASLQESENVESGRKMHDGYVYSIVWFSMAAVTTSGSDSKAVGFISWPDS